MKKSLSLSLVVALLLICSVAFAGAQDFTLVNATGHDITHVYVSPSSANDWQEDIMGRDILADGDSVTVEFARSEAAAHWDIKVIYADGSSQYWTGFNLKQISRITLKPNGNAVYE